MTRWIFSVGLLLAGVVPIGAAPPADIAAVFPSSTLIYAEVNTPAEVAPQIAALVKGTPLEDSIPFLHAKKSTAKSFHELHAQQELAAWALWLSPEGLAEVGKLKGIAGGLMGFSDRGEPEWAIAVLTGDSTAAGFAARAFLTTRSTLREVGKVGTVPIFQHKTPPTKPDPTTGRPMLDPGQKLSEGRYEPTFAYTPGLFVAGTSKNAIAPILERFAGSPADTLFSQSSFTTAAADYRQAGLFFFVNSPNLLTQLDEAGRKRTEPYVSEFLAWLRIVAPQKAVPWLAGRVQFRDGGMALTIGLALDASQKSLLRDVLAGSAAASEWLHHAAKPASWAVAMKFPENNRASTLVQFLDSFAKAQGVVGKLPSDYLQEAEDKHKLPLRSELLAAIHAATIVRTRLPELPKDAKPLPLLVFHLREAKAAAQWEAGMPKLVSVIAGDEPAQPATESIGDVRVFGLPSTGLPWKSAVYYARRDTVFVVGQDRKQVAAAVVADVASSVLGGQPPREFTVGEPAVVGLISLGELLGMIDIPQSIITGTPSNSFLPPPLAPSAGPTREQLQKDLDQARRAFWKALDPLPLARLTVRRTGERLSVELFQPQLQHGSVTPVVNAALDWCEKWFQLNPRGHHSFQPGPFSPQ
jgi:hypothetical protein